MPNPSDLHISVQGLSKKFSRSLKKSFLYGAQDILRGIIRIPGSTTLRTSEFWALQDINFKLYKGQTLGLVGLNGSGKTTLLRIISNILAPTQGTLTVHGRIAPMLALGAGFKPALSGYENIFLNLSLLGVPYQIIRNQLPSIVDFADIDDALHAPLGTYSSGMKSRLGFACAIHTNPQILVIDEVLAVGDSRFRMKCRNHMNILRKAGTSMLIVSHSAITLEALCDECLYLKKGQLIAQGKPSEILEKYEEDALAPLHDATSPPTNKAGSHALIQLLDVIPIQGESLKKVPHWTSGLQGSLLIHTRSQAALTNVSISVMLFDASQPGAPLLYFTSSRDLGWLTILAGEHTIHLTLPIVRLVTGNYRLKISLSQGPKRDLLDSIDDIKIAVRGPRAHSCLYLQERTWRLPDDIVSTPVLNDEPRETDFDDTDDVP